MSDGGSGRRARFILERASNYGKGFYQCMSLIGAVLVCVWLFREGHWFDELLGSSAEGVAIAVGVCSLVLLLATWRMPGVPTGLLGVVWVALLVAGSSLYFHRAPARSGPIAKVSPGASTAVHHSRSRLNAGHGIQGKHPRPARKRDIHAATSSGHHSRSVSAVASKGASSGAADSQSGGSVIPAHYVAERHDQGSERQPSHGSTSPETKTVTRETPPSPPPTVEGSGHAAATPTVEGGSKPVSEESATVEGSGK